MILKLISTKFKYIIVMLIEINICCGKLDKKCFINFKLIVNVFNRSVILQYLCFAYYLLFALARMIQTESAAAIRSSKFTLVHEIALSTSLVLFYKQTDK